MSDLVAAGFGFGFGLLMMAAVVVALRDEIAAGYRRKFGEPGSTQHARPARPMESTQRSRARVALAFYALAVASTLAVGIVLGQVIVVICGAVGMVSIATYILLERAG